MNERILELANIWANRRAEDEKLGIVYTFSEPALEQFAELIVQECIGAISEVKEVFFKFRLETDDFTEKNKFWAGEDACNQSVRKIETHFGVEE